MFILIRTSIKTERTGVQVRRRTPGGRWSRSGLAGREPARISSKKLIKIDRQKIGQRNQPAKKTIKTNQRKASQDQINEKPIKTSLGSPPKQAGAAPG